MTAEKYHHPQLESTKDLGQYKSRKGLGRLGGVSTKAKLVPVQGKGRGQCKGGGRASPKERGGTSPMRGQDQHKYVSTQ